ncbi:hypothetical protein [Mycobacteroides abscessus]
MNQDNDTGKQRNTVEDTRHWPAAFHIVGAMEQGGTGYLSGLEAAGQQQFLSSDVLPVEVHGGGSEDGWSILEQWGIERKNAVPGDELFVYANLPEGWSRQPAEDDRFSYLVDATGARRATIFYKAVPYDRRAYLSITTV